MTTTVYLGLGSNLGDREAYLTGAVTTLLDRGSLRDVRLSPRYETDAQTPDPQPPYLNAVVRGETALSPQALLQACLDIESQFGRVRPAGRSRAARTLDIDLLLFGDQVVDSPSLTVPHPAMLQRAFVLIPLADVAAPGLVHPVSGAPLGAAQPSASVRRLVPVQSEA